jgi:DNA-damage-inducible protein D
LSKVLGYLNWRNFEPVIEKAETACAGSGHAISDHFARTRTLIETGKGARREVDDVQHRGLLR